MNISRILFLIRIHEWWESKIGVACGLLFATAYLCNVPFSEIWYPIGILILSLSAIGIHASVINDITDDAEDRLAGKVTAMTGRGQRYKAVVLSLVFLYVAFCGCLLFQLRTAFFVYCLGHLVYTLYSVVPFRLKSRGAWGVLMIAMGDHLLPSLLSLQILAGYAKINLPISWTVAVAIWSLLVGFRSIMWHQLLDQKNDQVSKVNTLGAKFQADTIQALGDRIIFPAELTAFLLMCILNPNFLLFPFLLLYVFFEWLRYRYMHFDIVIVKPSFRFSFAMFDYYQIFFPISYSLAAAKMQTSGVLFSIAFAIVFFRPATNLMQHIGHILYWRTRLFIIYRVPLNETSQANSADNQTQLQKTDIVS